MERVVDHRPPQLACEGTVVGQASAVGPAVRRVAAGVVRDQGPGTYTARALATPRDRGLEDVTSPSLPLRLHCLKEIQNCGDGQLFASSHAVNEGKVARLDPASQGRMAHPEEAGGETAGDRLAQLLFQGGMNSLEVTVLWSAPLRAPQADEVLEESGPAIDDPHGVNSSGKSAKNCQLRQLSPRFPSKVRDCAISATAVRIWMGGALPSGVVLLAH
ncbi:MAG: hypothetical protein WD844_01240 [Thermoleophilaceae bacterium]